MRFVLILAFTSLIVLACRKSPTGPAVPEDPAALNGTLTVLQGRRPDVPVENATVMVVDGGMYTTDGSGQVTIPVEYEGRVVEIIGHGFLQPRRIHYWPGTIDHLLPDDDMTPGEWLMTAFYQTDESSLHRPYAGPVGVHLSDELRGNALFLSSAKKAIEYINRAQSDVEYFITDAAGAIAMELAPNDPIFNEAKYEDAWAVITGEFESGYTVSARVVWRFITRPEHHNLDSGALWQAVAHELGHYTGIWGHPPGGIMNERPVLDLSDFTGREKEAFRYLFLRSAGTRKPDDSTHGVPNVRTLRTQQSGTPQTFTVICGTSR